MGADPAAVDSAGRCSLWHLLHPTAEAFARGRPPAASELVIRGNNDDEISYPSAKISRSNESGRVAADISIVINFLRKGCVLFSTEVGGAGVSGAEPSESEAEVGAEAGEAVLALLSDAAYAAALAEDGAKYLLTPPSTAQRSRSRSRSQPSVCVQLGDILVREKSVMLLKALPEVLTASQCQRLGKSIAVHRRMTILYCSMAIVYCRMAI